MILGAILITIAFGSPVPTTHRTSYGYKPVCLLLLSPGSTRVAFLYSRRHQTSVFPDLMVSVEFHQRAQRSTCVGDMPTLLANAHMKRF